MTTNFRLLAMAAVAMLAMNSCVKEENLGNGENKGTPVEFEMGVNSVSRTSTPDDGYATTFVEGDEVGIFVYNGETPVVKNAHYILSADGKWEAQGTAITAEEGVSYSYYAYYPYNAEATDATSVSLTVAGDQTTGYTGSDALMAKSESVAAGTTSVQLQYSHAFALVQVSLKGDLAAKDATVTLQNVYPTAALNLKDGTVGEAAGALGTIAMKACSTNGESAPFNYRVIVPAQTITANNGILTTTSNGKNYKFTYSVDVPYESGKLRQFDVTLGETPAGTTIEIGEGTISNWEDSEGVEGGQGGVDEVGEPFSTSTIPFSLNTNPTNLGNYSTDKVTESTVADNSWFKREATDNTNAGVGTTVTFGNDNIKIERGKLTSTGWNNSSIGYRIVGNFERSTVYRLSFTVNNPGEANAAIGALIRTSDDTKAFAVTDTNGVRLGKTIKTATINPSATVDYTVEIDFSKKSGTANANNGNIAEDSFENTTDTDVESVNIYLYSNTDNSTLIVSNIVLSATDLTASPVVSE